MVKDVEGAVESGDSGAQRSCPPPIDRFTLGQKIIVRVCLYGFGVTGVVGAFAESWIAGVAVLAAAQYQGLGQVDYYGPKAQRVSCQWSDDSCV